jgi:uncharacterized membrane protein
MSGYNRIAGQSVERPAALSDGVFAVAMTLLLLELHVPSHETIHYRKRTALRHVWLSPAACGLSP